MQKEESKKKFELQLKKENKAISFHQIGKLTEAEEIYRELISLGSKNPIIYGNLAIICGLRKSFSEKIDLLKYSLELSPDNHFSHNNLGNAFIDTGDINAAISSYQQAIKYKPDYPEAYYNLAIVLKEQGDINAAISSYQQAIKYYLFIK